MKPRGGSLCAVGIGIRAPAQTTLEASSRIRSAQKVFSLVADPLGEYWIRSMNDNTESLATSYAAEKPLMDTYREMIDRVVGAVHDNLRVCVAAYGHPGVFAYPLHESIRQLRREGYVAEMLAGVSAENCLFAELGIDPGTSGCRSYEATDFLIRRRQGDTSTGLILWQIGTIGETRCKGQQSAWNPEGLVVLTETLLESYRREHEVVVYESARFPECDSTIARVPLKQLPGAPVTSLSTLYVPPMTRAPIDEAMMRRLRLANERGS